MAQDVVGSNLSDQASDQLKESSANYGQNGYSGASSDLPGKRTTSGFLPDTDYSAALATDKKIRNRDVSSAPITPSYGMEQRSPRGK